MGQGLTMQTFIKKFRKLIPPFLKYIIDAESHRIRKFVISCSQEIPSGSLVLDAGAGECQFKIFFEKHRYTAVDAAYGDETWDYSNIDIISSLDSMPFENNTFDAVICTQVLEHVNEPQQVLNELYRVLKHGGALYLSAPQGWGVHQAPHDYFRFTNYGLQYLLEKSGFNISYIKPSCGYFGYLANRLTVLPKTLFWQIENKLLRIALLPLEILSYIFFVLIFPVILNLMDFLDSKRDYTLNYFVKAVK